MFQYYFKLNQCLRIVVRKGIRTLNNTAPESKMNRLVDVICVVQMVDWLNFLIEQSAKNECHGGLAPELSSAGCEFIQN